MTRDSNTLCAAGEQQAPVVAATLVETLGAHVASRSKRPVDGWKDVVAQGKDFIDLLEGEDREKAEACIERLERLGTARSRAWLADNVYTDKKPPGDWQRLTATSTLPGDPLSDKNRRLRELLAQEKRWKGNYGIGSALYYTPSEDEYVIAFQGTSPTSASDWLTNVGASFGLYPNQYREADALTKELTGIVGEVEATGHSLGGGIATLVSMANPNVKATAFNPAGFTDNLLRMAGNTHGDARVDSYVVEGDIVTEAQKFSPLPDARGTVHKLEAVPESKTDFFQVLTQLGAGAAAVNVVQGANPGVAAAAAGVAGVVATGMAFESFRRHFMDYVTRGLEEQMEDEMECIRSFIYPLGDYRGGTEVPF